MTERITVHSVEFQHPFRLGGIGLQPAGIYEIETVEVPLENVSFVAYRRISTTITLQGNTTATASRQVVDVDPAELALALAADREGS